MHFHVRRAAAPPSSPDFINRDTAGQERYSGLAPLYYRGSQAAVVVYDITSTKSFERAKQWVKELQGQTDLSITVGLAANKTDLEDQRKVSEKVRLWWLRSQDCSEFAVGW